MNNVQRYNNLAAYYATCAREMRVHDAATQRAYDDYMALSQAAYNVANLFASGYSWARQQVPMLASAESNGRVRSFYQAVQF